MTAMRSLSDESVTTRPSLPLDDLPSTESLRRRNAEEDYTPDRVHFVRSDPNASVQNHSSSPRDQTSAELLKSTHGDEVFYFYACVGRSSTGSSLPQPPSFFEDRT
mmetsp:Transcript_5422/g.13641  ORF Transcript_5422/g.13641 Transcript_5422/m.13641 type:complete len:106 (-) Transcript_5422:47-364(-)